MSEQLQWCQKRLVAIKQACMAHAIIVHVCTITCLELSFEV